MAASRLTTVSPRSELEADTKVNHLVAAQLSKTKMCAMYARGSCIDPRCRFAHSQEELRKAPDLTKTAICRAFARGQCRVSGCKFAHGEQELRVTPSVYKTQICNFFAQGYCKKGAECRHAHGVSELRSFQGAPLAAQPHAEAPRGGPGAAAAAPPPRGPPAARAPSPQCPGRPGGAPGGRAPQGARAPAARDAGRGAAEGPEWHPPAGPPRARRGLELPEPMKVRLPEPGPHLQQPLFRPSPPPAAAGLAARDGGVAAAALAAARAAREHSAAASAAYEVAAKLAAAVVFGQQEGRAPPGRDGLRVLHELALLGIGGHGGCPARAEDGLLHLAKALSVESPPGTPPACRSGRPGSPWHPAARSSSTAWVV